MRIVVVEDEPKTRDGLLRIIDRYTDHEVVCTVGDGLSGVAAVLEQRPDLVLSDIRMPGMDGLQMIEQLADQGVDFQAILLTGHADFEYARRAVQLEVVGYILKPLEIEEFLQALEKAENRLEKREMARVSVGQLIFSVMTCSREEKWKLLFALNERLQLGAGDQATLFLVRPGSLDNETATEMQYRLEQVIGSVYMGSYYVCRLPGGLGILAILMDTEQNPTVMGMFRTKVLPQLQTLGPCCCSSSSMQDVEQLEREIHMMDELQKYSLAFGPTDILEKETVAALAFGRLDYPEDLENCIRKEIRRGNPAMVEEIGRQFHVRVIDSNGSPEHIREYTAKFCSSALSAMNEWGAEAGSGGARLEFHHLIRNVIGSQSKEDLLLHFSKVLALATTGADDPAHTENAIILKVIAFIRNNYSGDITLTDAAELVGITPEYLSKLFNQEVSVNFVVFLRNFRISVAKRMLATGKNKIHEIAELVGFRDVKYFNKVFKSVCGISPSDYKKGLS